MDAQAINMYQRNPNDQGPNGSQRPNLNNGSNGNNGGGPGRNGTRSVLLRSLLIVVVVLLAWGLFTFFTQSSNGSPQDVLEVPYSTFYQQVKQDNVKDVVFQGQDATGDFRSAISVPGSNNGNPSTRSPSRRTCRFSGLLTSQPQQRNEGESQCSKRSRYQDQRIELAVEDVLV